MAEPDDKPKPLPRTPEEQYKLALDGYDEQRNQFLSNSVPSSNVRAPITDAHGAYIPGSGGLTERYAGVDKLFYTLIQGVVDDPDYALRKDAKVYKRMMRDPQIFYCLQVRKAATTSLSWSIVPPSGMENDPQALEVAQASEKRLKKMPRANMLFDNILDAMLPGLSVNEIVWEFIDGEYIISEHFPVNKDRVLFDKVGNLRLKQPAAPTTGIPVPPYKFITHTYALKDGSWAYPSEIGYSYYGCGLADTPLYHYFYFKISALRFFLKSMERYGMPHKLFYSGMPNEALSDRIATILTSLQNDSVTWLPGKKGDMFVDYVKPPTSEGIFMTFIEYVDKLITRTILYQELMTEMPAVGSYAAAQVHQSVFARVAEADRRALEETLSKTLIKWDVELNSPGVPAELMPKFIFKNASMADASGFLQTVAQAQQLGLTIAEPQVRELTGLREPNPNENVLMPTQMQPSVEGPNPGPMGSGGAPNQVDPRDAQLAQQQQQNRKLKKGAAADSRKQKMRRESDEDDARSAD